MFSQDDLTKLINAGPGIGVSLFLPTKMVGRETLREWTKHGGHAARFLFATVSRPSRTAALVTATR
jgi:hypothetical protein